MSNIDAALFQQMRFSILSTTLNREEESPFSEAYLYAWDSGVYPFFDDGADWHQPHKDMFAISEEKVDELSKFLDKKWMEKEPISFYELEDHFEVHGLAHSTGDWSRTELICVCRYLFLLDHFDNEFWDKLVKNGECPAEAHSIRTPFKDTMIYFN